MMFQTTNQQVHDQFENSKFPRKVEKPLVTDHARSFSVTGQIDPRTLRINPLVNKPRDTEKLRRLGGISLNKAINGKHGVSKTSLNKLP